MKSLKFMKKNEKCQDKFDCVICSEEYSNIPVKDIQSCQKCKQTWCVSCDKKLHSCPYCRHDIVGREFLKHRERQERILEEQRVIREQLLQEREMIRQNDIIRQQRRQEYQEQSLRYFIQRTQIGSMTSEEEMIFQQILLEYMS